MLNNRESVRLLMIHLCNGHYAAMKAHSFSENFSVVGNLHVITVSQKIHKTVHTSPALYGRENTDRKGTQGISSSEMMDSSFFFLYHFHCLPNFLQ